MKKIVLFIFLLVLCSLFLLDAGWDSLVEYHEKRIEQETSP